MKLNETVKYNSFYIMRQAIHEIRFQSRNSGFLPGGNASPFSVELDLVPSAGRVVPVLVLHNGLVEGGGQ